MACEENRETESVGGLQSRRHGFKICIHGVEGNRLVTLALDARSGELLWKQQAPEVHLAPVHQANSHAASTPCVDGQRLYVYFASYRLLCYDHDGRELWRKPIPLDLRYVHQRGMVHRDLRPSASWRLGGLGFPQEHQRDYNDL